MKSTPIMLPSGRILLVDEDPAFVEIYKEMLEIQGVEVTIAYSTEDAIRTLEADGGMFDVVLLDRKLKGAGGSAAGLELIPCIRELAPFVETIIVTADPSPHAIERAFELDVYDYLVKNGAFEARLRATVRNALEVATERRAASRSRDDLVHGLRTVREQVRAETDLNRKGKLLEELVKDLFRATPGFEHVRTRLSNESEEIDIVIENRSEDPLWRNDGGQYLLAECKNWSSPCDAKEFRNFHSKLTGKYKRARTGFFIAPG